MEESNQSILENAIESYHEAIESKSLGFLIIASFTSICKWLRYEKEFNNIETWRIARTIVFELNPQETGDLILCLLLQRVIVENNEDESVQKKYLEEIESICNDQLEGQSIYNESLEMANKIYQEYRSQSKH